MVLLTTQESLANIQRTLKEAKANSNQYDFSHVEINISSALEKEIAAVLIQDIDTQLFHYHKNDAYTFTTNKCSNTKYQLMLDDDHPEDTHQQIYALMNLLYSPFANHYGKTGSTSFSARIRARLVFKSPLNDNELFKTLIIDHYNKSFQII